MNIETTDKHIDSLKKSNLLKKKPCQIIDMISKGELIKNNFYISDAYNELFDIKDKDFFDFLKTIITKKGDPTSDKKYIEALYKMFERKDFWIRNINSWKRKSHNVDKQINNIAKHLFCKYDVPNFMYKSWYKEKNVFHSNWVDWFIHIGQGGNIRTTNIPTQLTKKMAHHFLQSPDVYTPIEALRWGQIYGLGGNEKTVRRIVDSKIGDNFKNDDFWITVIHFIIRNPMLDPVQISPMIDYISYLKYEGDRVYDDGGLRDIPPPKPNFEMKGRTIESLMRGMETWHKEIGKNDKKGTPQKWQGYDIENFEYKTGKDKNLKIFKIQQLLTAKELKKEGTTHKHCVGSYTRSCETGRSSIWSLSIKNFLGQNKPLLTIGLNKDRYINQVRGKNNRTPTNYELSIIQKWMDKEDLKISKWI